MKIQKIKFVVGGGGGVASGWWGGSVNVNEQLKFLRNGRGSGGGWGGVKKKTFEWGVWGGVRLLRGGGVRADVNEELKFLGKF